jgi:hypothetical protein
MFRKAEVVLLEDASFDLSLDISVGNGLTVQCKLSARRSKRVSPIVTRQPTVGIDVLKDNPID